MKKPAKKITPNQREFQNEVRKVKRRIRDLRSEGIFVEYEIPTPSRVTSKQLTKIKSITKRKLRDIYKKQQIEALNIKQEKEKIVPKKVHRAIRKPKSAKKLYYPEVNLLILNNVREMIENFTPMTNWSEYFTQVKIADRNISLNILNGAISEYGEAAVAKRLNAHARDINELVLGILYDSGRDEVQSDLQRFSAIVTGRALTVQESKDLAYQIDEFSAE